MKKEEKPYWMVVFPSSLGWFALLGDKGRIKELTFGHPSSRSAKKALSHGFLAQARSMRGKPPLVRRLQAYAKGTGKDDFRDIRLDLGGLSVFQRRVLALCRKIPFGTRLSYAQLAARVGSPRAYRAVGNCMAGNKIPIIIPCHRVVPSSGGLGSYSAPGGMLMKKRLLGIENPAFKCRGENQSRGVSPL
ncbi:MAG: methylated-DNA--[protein]-cysteine S-methyltransferase [Thermoguttaceae bacterium]|jgi:methylated-DNA-[protein]-cysteine S-methyltransferase